MGEVIFNLFKNRNYIDLDMYQSGQEACHPGQIFGPAARNHFLFHYVMEGCGTLIAADKDKKDQTFQVYAGQGFLIFPDQITTYISSMETPWTYCWIEFDGLRVKEALDLTELSQNSPVYRTHTPELRDEMAAHMKMIVMNAKTMSSMAAIGHLYLFFDALVQSCRRITSTQVSPLADFYIKEAVSYIEQNYQKPLTIEEIANVLGIDRSYFGKVFKRVMGKSPQQFLINYRLVKAAELLRSTSSPIGEIAEQVGYENQLHFSRAFKSAYGLSPRQWRKEQA